jgi:translation elongation factor P/translation initiation factor 5A
VVISRHSGTKIKVELEGVLEKSKKLLTLSPHEEIEKIEIIRKHGQILSISGSIAQVMSMDDYRTFDACVQEELLKEIKEGDEVTYVEFEGVANVVEIRK